MAKIDSSTFHKKREKLAKLSRHLKRKYVGIDEVIDEIIKSLEAWYLMPELLTRPTIINLWGTTGVGKTELVDTIAKQLGLSKQYTKVELSASNARGYSVLELFTSKSNVISGKQNIIFFDEFQNFRTVDSQGNDLKNPTHTDFWELLNDGRIATKNELRELREDFHSLGDRKGKRLVKSTWMGTESELTKIKALLGLDATTTQIGEWPVTKLNRTLRIHARDTFHKLDCTRSLIIIAGNLDEAYRFSDQVDEIDLDADDYNKLSKTVNFLTIKRALTKRFKPEQIARLGNTHIIYPCLDRSAYTKLISRTLKKIVKHLKSIAEIELTIDKSVHKVIYDNGVFPTQGARPVFTTIREVLENNIPRIALFCTDHNTAQIKVSYQDKFLLAETGKQSLKIPYEGKVHALKKKHSKDERALVAVHEAAHAVVFADLFLTAPEKIVVDTVSGGKAGFVKNPGIYRSKEFLEQEVIVQLAGQRAEYMIFGKENISSGASADIAAATETVCLMVRQFGMSRSVGNSGSESDLNSSALVTQSRDEAIDQLLSQLKSRAEQAVTRNRGTILSLAKLLLTKKSITKEEFISFLKERGVEVSNREKIFPPYHQKLLVELDKNE